MDVDSRLKTALDESRLLILGAQVLFGFQFEAVFQERFPEVSGNSQLLHNTGLVLMLVSISLLIAPSLFHQIIFRGESKPAAIEAATLLAGASLLPLTVGLGISAFVVFEHGFGRAVGTVIGTTFTATGLALLYGLGFALKRNRKKPENSQMQETSKTTPLKTKIEQMLTEARVIIPGGQALLGFQLVATLTKAFNELPALFKYIHCAGLCAVALAVILLMTPAAVHRLAIGISSDVAVVFFKTTESTGVALGAGAAALAALLGFWLAYPLWHRIRFNP
jgi:hypothetical protein